MDAVTPLQRDLLELIDKKVKVLMEAGSLHKGCERMCIEFKDAVWNGSESLLQKHVPQILLVDVHWMSNSYVGMRLETPTCSDTSSSCLV